MFIFKRVFTFMAICMIGFGIIMGIIFPFFVAATGVPTSYVITPLFFTLCILAGFIVGLINIYIAKIMVGNRLKPVITNLNDSTYQVASASVQLISNSQNLAEGNVQLASSIEETSSTLEEFTSMINQNNENTHQAAHLSDKAKAIADKGYSEMRSMQTAISEIKKSSDQMAKIVKVIDEIAFQTNILAINAAVEAARAGEFGLSFSVVADEVRNLAGRSAEAAKNVAEIIEKNIQLSNQGVEETQKIADSLAHITEQSSKVNELIDEIAAASKEQAQGISSISKAISQMENVTHANAANAEETASSAEQLSAQANVLNDMAVNLNKFIYGNSQIKEKTKIEKNIDDRLKNFKKPENFEKKTKIVSPEEVIPLEDDNGGFN